ncbi:hypothetical protein [Marinobacter sp. DUT-1]|uniref:hypothetical protein n=1 Tax=Marinobacter sp. DUT-1 TaxID=3412037 RepID=UPI003D16B3A2
MKTLSSKGLTEKDLLVLKSLVDLMMSRTNDTWEYAESENCDAVIIDTDNLQNSTAVIDEIESRHAVAIEYSTGANAGNARFRIKKPLRAADLIAVFNSVEAGLTPTNATTPAQVQNTQSPTKTATKGDSGLPDLLGNSDLRFLTVETPQGQCLIDLVNNRYELTGDLSLEELLQDSEKKISLNEPPGHQDDLDTNWRTAPSIKWKLGIFLSEGALIKNLHSKSRFKLLRWPPSDIPRALPSAMALSALFSRKSGATIEEASSETNVSPEETVGFINAAYLSGVLSVRAFNLGEHHLPAQTAHSRGLFDKIRDRLKRKPK